jgi:DNA repair protein RadD
MQLRPYQDKTINALFHYFEVNQGNPLIVAPTGSGKSVIIAEFIRRALARFPYTRATILAHRTRLVQQNAAKLQELFPDCPMGIYAAALKQRNVKQITFAMINSVHSRGSEFGYQDLILIDEAHRMRTDEDGMFNNFIADIRRTNPRAKVIGFTATPYRMDSGMLLDGDAPVFTDIAYELQLKPLIDDGYLCSLVSKHSKIQADLSTVRIRGGEFVQSDCERIMDDDILTTAAIEEITRYGADRKSWLIFCAGVEHTKHVTEKLKAKGIDAAYITEETTESDRATIFKAFEAGHIRALLNCDVLTTGFDSPNIDMLVLLRPTQSVGLYVQMCGRGCRLFPNKDNCLVLDFAGNIERFGPLDLVNVKRKKGKAENQKAPTKNCPVCESVLPIPFKTCPTCSHEFPTATRAKHDTTATDRPILSTGIEWDVHEIRYGRHEKNGKVSMRVDYYSGSNRVSEWVSFEGAGMAKAKAWQWWQGHTGHAEALVPQTVDEALERLPELRRPIKITVSVDGKFFRVQKTIFGNVEDINFDSDILYNEHGLNV